MIEPEKSLKFLKNLRISEISPKNSKISRKNLQKFVEALRAPVGGSSGSEAMRVFSKKKFTLGDILTISLLVWFRV